MRATPRLRPRGLSLPVRGVSPGWRRGPVAGEPCSVALVLRLCGPPRLDRPPQAGTDRLRGQLAVGRHSRPSPRAGRRRLREAARFGQGDEPGRGAVLTPSTTNEERRGQSMSAALLVSAGWGASNGRECRNGRRTVIRPCSPPSFRRFVIPTKAGIQVSHRRGDRRRAVSPIVIPAKVGIQRSPRTGIVVGPCPDSSFRRKPESRGHPGQGIPSDRTPLPIPSGYGGRIGRATDTTPQEDESRRNAFVCDRRYSSARLWEGGARAGLVVRGIPFVPCSV